MDAHGGAPRNSEDVRVRQRIAEQRLQQHTCQSEETPDPESRENPRQTDDHHDVARGIIAAAEQGSRDLTHANSGAADDQRRQKDRRRQRNQRR